MAGKTKLPTLSPQMQVVKDWIDWINSEATNLTDWEEEFMEDITERFNLYSSVTSAQARTIERIYAEKTK